MRKYIIAAMAVALAVLPAGAQTLKAVKDKATKLFGYQDENKNWVIEPQFNTAKKFQGPVAPVMIKEGRTKVWGVTDKTGTLVIPVECLGVAINDAGGVINADRYFDNPMPERYNNNDLHAWGVYDLEGNELWAPQFASKVSFDGNGNAIVSHTATNKYGIINLDGTVVLPLENYYVSGGGNNFEVIGPCLERYNLKLGAANPSTSANPFLQGHSGVTPCWIPYNTEGDDVKAAAYGHRKIGVKLPYNTVYVLGSDPSERFQTTLERIYVEGEPLDWGRHYTRFIRLELAYAGEHTECVCPNPETGANYTVVANLYEADGSFVECICPDGMLYAELSEGILYETASGDYWFIAGDINWPFDSKRTTLNINKKIDSSDIYGLLGLNPTELNDLHDYYQAGRRHRNVELADVGGLLSYAEPAEIGSRETEHYQSWLLENYEFLRRRYRMGQVYSIYSFNQGSYESTVKVREQLRANNDLDYGGFHHTLSEPVYWGPKGDRYIRIVPIPSHYMFTPSSSDGIVDDRSGKKYVVTFEFRLYEDDGTFVQTLGRAKTIWFGGDDVVGFKGTEWVFTRLEPRNGSIKFRGHREPFKGRIEELDYIQF